ncbi:MAG: hydrogenase maturation nickel metallochaperone HypA [Planctomycetes bacterium]|nr:hydrogenase maturation nickel metallochaperone HypA [Planctomycetota bacterium]
MIGNSRGGGMLVRCPDCNVEFSPSLGRCPRCGIWAPTEEQCDEFQIVQIQSALTDGQTVRQIRDDLISQGYEPQVAQDLIIAAKDRMRPGHRRLGMQLAFKGLLLMGVSSLLYVTLFGMVWFYGLFAVGLALFIVGVIKGWTGWHLQ